MRCESWMDRTQAQFKKQNAFDGRWHRDGHRIQRCDFTTGHFLRDVALCDSDDTAEFLLGVIKEAQANR